MEQEKDLFEYFDELPVAVQEAINEFNYLENDTIKEMQRLQEKLNKLGYDFEYDFNEAWGLHKMEE